MLKFNIINEVVKLLSHVPLVKIFFKKIYVHFFFLINIGKSTAHGLASSVSIKKDFGKNTFFGYYDKSPTKNHLTIFHFSKIKTSKKPNSEYPVQIILYNSKTNEEKILDESYAYNWQQGSKLQWLDDEKIIYNDYDKKYISKVYNVYTNELVKIIDFPIYDCYLGEYALSLNFTRLLHFNPDYGYRMDKIRKKNLPELKNDGLFLIDINRNRCDLIISLLELSNLCPKETMKNAYHIINHIMISPNGKNAIFIHRWYNKLGKRYDRLINLNMETRQLNIIVDDNMVSHCCWCGNDFVIGYLSYSGENDFYKININTNKLQQLSPKLEKLGDGHPSIYGDKMLFDSYPNKSRMKQLYIYYLTEDKLEMIGEYFEPLKYFGETRCDLHPRWSDDGKSFFIDSTHEGIRKLYEISLT